METTDIYSSKAVDYAKYRLEYVPQAIAAIANHACLASGSVVADIGSGTGALCQHFLRLGCEVYAIEPNASMRREAERLLSGDSSFHSLAGQAESVPLPDASVELIVVGQAVHWFDPFESRKELRRALRPNGWVAFISNTLSSQPWLDELAQLLPSSENQGEETTPSAYLDDTDFMEYSFGNTVREGWDQFIGGARSAAAAPDSHDAAYSSFEEVHREVFETHSVDGLLEVVYSTDVVVGMFPKTTAEPGAALDRQGREPLETSAFGRGGK
jgi:SAM-dependent methyltransferase